MPADRKQFRKSSQRFFTRFDDWTAPQEFINIYRDAMDEAETRRKVRQYGKVIDSAAEQARAGVKRGDFSTGEARGVIESASLYYLFTGDRKALNWAKKALDVLERFERPHWCYITLIGRVDIALSTAGVTHALALMRSCFGDALDDDTRRCLDRIAVQRCLRPALKALRTRKYFWTECTHNWRSVMTGSFAMGAMAFADVFRDWRELVEYGLEGVLVVLDEGDRAGGWQEGPGYWEYGIGHCAEFGLALKRFTGGTVDLFQHRYLKQTGDFLIHMTTVPGRVWGWSDCGKTMGSSGTLIILAREYGNPAYQAASLVQGVGSIRNLFHLDLGLKKAFPSPGTGFPLTKVFPDIGVAAMRTGYGRNDLFVGVKAGTIGPGVNHEHADLGSVTIHSGKEELLAELGGWPYAQATGKAGGFFAKGGRRWDYDGNDVNGHNLAMLEGRYRPFADTRKARLRHTALNRNAELITVDATAMHKDLARLVRRYVVYIRPDVVLLVDEIRARQPDRARSLFHYLNRAETGPDHFTITTGSAQLRGTSLYPSVDDNCIIGRDERKVAYHTERGLQHLKNSYIYISNLHRTKDIIFLTGLQVATKSTPEVRWSVEGDPASGKPFTVVVRRRSSSWRIRVDLAKNSISAK